MYVDAAIAGDVDATSEAHVVSAIRSALRPLERSLQRVVAHVQPKGERHICRLRAWSERGHTVVVESCARSRDEAVAAATDGLKRALERAPASRCWPPPAEGGLQSGKSVSTQLATLSRGEAGSNPERATRVLLVLRDLDCGAASLHWSTVLVESLAADLAICRVLPELKATASLLHGQAWLDATRRVLSATRETRIWCDQILPHATLAERGIAAGVDPGKLGSVAHEQGADWIVVSAHVGCGAAAAALARAAGRPVLVARAPTTRHTLLVVTEVEADNHPALDRAARLAVALQASVLVFHDVQSLSHDEMSFPQVDALAEPWARIQKTFQGTVDLCPPDLDVVLACSGDRVQEILQQARREDAEMILMGLPAEESARRDAVVAAVADGALRSVLIVPSPTPPRATVDDASSEGWNQSSTGIRRIPRLRSQSPMGSQRRRRRQ